MNKNITILDDDERFAKDICRKLENIPAIKSAGYQVIPCETGEFLEDISVLEKRATKGRRPPKYKETSFDLAGILVVDYDIAKLPNLGGLLTGERVAYLARCYSGCGPIIALNQFGSNTFDLRLSGHPESYADLNIGDRQIDCTGLWSESWRNEFRPWHWPLLLDAHHAFERRIRSIKELDVPIFEQLGVPAALVPTLPASALSWLAPRLQIKRIPEVTFRRFLDESEFALRGSKDKTTEEYEKRIVAARISKWIERFLLPGQHILVDAPHLVTRFPSLMRENPTQSNLNKLCRLGADVDTFLDKRISTSAFKATDWLSRPAWWWEQVRNCEDIAEVKEPWRREEIEFRFCEDTSDFRAPKNVTEFAADLSTSFTRRYVAKLSDVDYMPALQFAL